MSSAEKWKILLVEDDDLNREAMEEWLLDEGFEVIAVGDGQEALKHIHEGIAVIVTDLKMPKSDGLDLLRVAREQAPYAAVILVTGHGTVETAVAALKEGAFDYLTKPINPQELTHRVRQAIDKRTMTTEIARLHAQLQQRDGFADFIGKSKPMREIFEKIRLVGRTKSTVLITGESGTGKELVARAIHENSERQAKPFIPVNCAALPESLIESELFGHVRGAFTGAVENRIGLFQSAQGGTLFIDEIGEMTAGAQSKLLRVLETRKLMPVGSSKEIEVDVRVLAATNRDLKEEAEQGNFREDLFYRLKVVELHLPPLRERKDDIPLLVRHFLEKICTDNERPICDITSEAFSVLMSYDWPGNVRELANTLEGIVVLLPKDLIEVKDLPAHLQEPTKSQSLIQTGMSMEEIEKEAIRRALEQTKGNRTEASKLLGISVRTLQRKIKEES